MGGDRSRSPSPSLEEMYAYMQAEHPQTSDNDIKDEVLHSRNPSIHRCTAQTCPYMSQNRDSTYYCLITGICFEQRTVADAFTAGQVSSLDENNVRRGESYKHRFAISALQKECASKNAYMMARTIDETSTTWKPPTVKRRKSSGPRRTNAGRTPDTSQLQAFRMDAAQILDKLTFAQRNAVPSTSESLSPVELKTQAYIRRCQITGGRPLLDDIHNIVLSCLAEESRSPAGANIASATDYPMLREKAAAFVVSLWICILPSPFMARQKRASDNFKPFAAGVFFSMRRGIFLDDGTMLVPRCKALSTALPVVRAAHRGTPTHTAHLSAHRGVSTLQRVISSIPEERVYRFFQPAIHAAKAFANSGQ